MNGVRDESIILAHVLDAGQNLQVVVNVQPGNSFALQRHDVVDMKWLAVQVRLNFSGLVKLTNFIEPFDDVPAAARLSSKVPRQLKRQSKLSAHKVHIVIAPRGVTHALFFLEKYALIPFPSPAPL